MADHKKSPWTLNGYFKMTPTVVTIEYQISKSIVSGITMTMSHDSWLMIMKHGFQCNFSSSVKDLLAKLWVTPLGNIINIIYNSQILRTVWFPSEQFFIGNQSIRLQAQIIYLFAIVCISTTYEYDVFKIYKFPNTKLFTNKQQMNLIENKIIQFTATSVWNVSENVKTPTARIHIIAFWRLCSMIVNDFDVDRSKERNSFKYAFVDRSID